MPLSTPRVSRRNKRGLHSARPGHRRGIVIGSYTSSTSAALVACRRCLPSLSALVVRPRCPPSWPGNVASPCWMTTLPAAIARPCCHPMAEPTGCFRRTGLRIWRWQPMFAANMECSNLPPMFAANVGCEHLRPGIAANEGCKRGLETRAGNEGWKMRAAHIRCQ